MIFERFRSPKYKHQDPQIRELAIAALDPSNPKHKSALHELAFNDSHSAVRIAALTQLASFPLWLKAADTAESNSVKQHAKQVIIAILDNQHSIRISDKEFSTLVSESNNQHLLENLVFNNARLKADEALCLQALNKLSNQYKTLQFFKEHASEWQQQQIIKQGQEVKTLNKLRKSARSEIIIEQIDAQLAAIKAQEEKPLQILRDAKMINAKLLALNETQDYADLQQGLAELSSQFEHLKPTFVALNEDDAAQVISRYLELSEQLQKRLLKLKPAWEQKQRYQANENELAALNENFSQIKLHIIRLIEASLSSPSQDIEAESRLLQKSVVQLTNDAAALAELDQAQQAQLDILKRDVLALSSACEALPDTVNLARYAQSRCAAVQASWQSDQASDNAQHVSKLKELREHKCWKNLPSFVHTEVANTLKQEQAHHRANQRELQERQNKLRKQCQAIMRSIEQGKFKVALAQHKRFIAKWVEAGDEVQAKLQRQFEQVSQEIDKLQSLQAFIAGPRKPELIQRAEQLAQDTAPKDIKKRQQDVAILRDQWRSLGELDTAEDKAYKASFDLAIEHAFAPCRAHFAEQEKQRTANADKATAYIEKMSALCLEDNQQAFVKAFTRIKSQFYAIKALPREQASELRQQFKQASMSAEAQVKEIFANNAAAKGRLLEQVKAIDTELIEQATAEAKNLQQRWRDIGPCDNKTEQALWREFSQVNDAIFARAKALREQSKQTSKAHANQIAIELDNMPISSTDSSALQQVQTRLGELRAELSELDKSHVGQLSRRINEMSKRVAQTLTDIRLQQRKNDRLAALFALPHADASALNKESSAERHELLLQAELILDIASPPEDAKRRKDIQLTLMARRLEGQSLPAVDLLIDQWINCGPLTESDSMQVARIKTLIERYTDA